ncbi:MAG: glycosyltransferase [Litorimonas sp.]
MSSISKDEKSEMQVCWIVLGMHRSGTSAFANVLHSMGAIPPKNLLPPTEENPKGYWESKTLMILHDNILAKMDSSWSDWRRLDLANTPPKSIEAFKDQIKVSLYGEFETFNNALIKDPRMCRFYPLFKDILRDENVHAAPLLIVRNPLEVARSLAARANMGVNEGLLLWLRYVLDSEKFSRDQSRLIITFKDLMASPLSIEKRVVDFQKSMGFPPLKSSKRKNVIDTSLRHHTLDGIGSIDGISIPDWVSETYGAMRTLAKIDVPEDAKNIAFKTLDRIYQEFSELETVFFSVIEEKTKNLKLYQEHLGKPPFGDDSLKALLHAREKEVAQKTARLSSLKDLNASVTQEIEALATDYQESKKINAGEKEELESKINDLNLMKSQLEKRIETKTKALNALEAQLKEGSNVLESKEASLQDALNQLNITKNALSKKEKALSTAQTRLKSVSKQSKVVLSKVQETFHDELSTLKSSQQADLRRARAELIFLSTQLENVTENKTALLSEVAKLKALTKDAENPKLGQKTNLAKVLEVSNIKLSYVDVLKEKLSERKIREFNLFDDTFYLNQLTELNLGEAENLLQHYLRKGFLLGLNPHPLFDTNWYQNSYPDIAESGINPLIHYVRHGDAEGRDPHPLFKTHWFRTNTLKTQDLKTPALTQFLSLSANELTSPHPAFSVENYYATHPDVKKAKLNALLHYMRYGHTEFRNPNASFQEGWYKNKYGDLIPDGMSALEYHLRSGIIKGYLTHPLENREGRERNQNRPRKNILVVAHSASDRIFGAERSLLDVLACIDKESFNVILALPAQNNFYINAAQQYVDEIVFYSREWWNTRQAFKEKNLKFFKQTILEKKIDLIYVNTIMLPAPLSVAKSMGLPSVMHIRELIDRDEALKDHIGLSSEDIVKEVSNAADILIANSIETESLFRHSNKCLVVPNAINVDGFGEMPPFSSDGMLRVGMLSSNIKKKGVDELHKLAIAAEKENLPFIFLAYGPETDDVRRIKSHIKSVGGPSNLIFPGYVQDPKDAVRKLDVVVNLSLFAESFGRTAVEAMSAGRPIIGYNHGALREVIDHNGSGFHIQYKRPQEAIHYLKKFIETPSLLSEMGKKGHERAQTYYSYNTLSRNINALFHTALVEDVDNYQDVFEAFLSEPVSVEKGCTSSMERPKVSVVVPNYNYAHYLEERLGSILSQTYLPTEIIFLDDCSPDNSLEVAKEILERQANGDNPVPYRIIPNEKNVGVYRQWLKAVEEAKEDWIWIAEADDTSHPKFLETLVSKVKPRTSLVYCQSRKIDVNGEEISPNNFAHTNDISPTKWMSDYQENGVYEVVNSLAYRNSIPNTSSAIFRKSAAKGMGPQLTTFKYSGDWFFYSYLLARGDVGYSRQPLNNFRRHDGGVTRQQSKTSPYLIELSRIREYICKTFPILPSQIERLNWFLNRDYKIEGVEKNTEFKAAALHLENAKRYTETRKRIAIITTNNGSYNGGSEMLWQETALELRKEGHDVHVLIKRWVPEPPLFNDLQFAGVKLFFKDDNGFDKLLKHKPDLTLISIGDQDEGLEYYPALLKQKLPYVIVNQLTKEARFWHVREKKTLPVTLGYLNAERVFFTCWNNHRVMEERLGTVIPNAAVHFNPYHIDRKKVPPYPPVKDGYKIAVPSKLLFIHKGQDLLIDVLKQDKWRDRNVIFNFYGAGPDRDNLQALINKHSLKNCVLKGRVDDISEIWKENHASCMPSRMEGLPIMIVSAMLSARPCIATDIGGHAEVISDGASGFIIPNPNVSDLDKTLERAFEKRRSWRKMGQEARRDILNYLPEDPIEDFVIKLNDELSLLNKSNQN